MEEKKRVTAMLTDSEAVFVKEFILLLRNRPGLIEYFRLQSSPFQVLCDDYFYQKYNGILEMKKNCFTS